MSVIHRTRRLCAPKRTPSFSSPFSDQNTKFRWLAYHSPSGIDNAGGTGAFGDRKSLKVFKLRQEWFKSMTDEQHSSSIDTNKLYTEHFRRPDELEPGNWGDQYGIPPHIRPHIPIGGRFCKGVAPNWTIWRYTSETPVRIESRDLAPNVKWAALTHRLKSRRAEKKQVYTEAKIRAWHLWNTPFPTAPDRRLSEISRSIPPVSDLWRRFEKVVFLVHSSAEVSPSREVSDVDRPLSPKGAVEAQTLLDVYGARLGDARLILTCHSARCVSTASILAGRVTAETVDKPSIVNVPELYFGAYPDCLELRDKHGFAAPWTLLQADFAAVHRYCATAWRAIHASAMMPEWDYMQVEAEARGRLPTLVVVGHAMWTTAMAAFLAPQGGVSPDRLAFRLAGMSEGFIFKPKMQRQTATAATFVAADALREPPRMTGALQAAAPVDESAAFEIEDLAFGDQSLMRRTKDAWSFLSTTPAEVLRLSTQMSSRLGAVDEASASRSSASGSTIGAPDGI